MRGKILPAFRTLEFGIVVFLVYGLQGGLWLLRSLGHPLPVPVFLEPVHLQRTLAWELGLMVVLGLFLYRQGWRPGDVHLRISARDTWLGCSLMVGSCVLYFAFYLAVCGVKGMEFMGFVVMPGPLGLGRALLLVLVHPLFEEWITLGYVTRVLASQGAGVAIGTSVFLRLFVHLGQGPMAVASLLPMGLLYAVCYWRMRRLWPFLVAHALLEAVPLLAIG
nr:CPBP family intramembrane glutamic endopeptidase [uncultured Holophaga sp.]